MKVRKTRETGTVGLADTLRAVIPWLPRFNRPVHDAPSSHPSLVNPGPPRVPLPTAWSIEVFRIMAWQRFEAVCAAYFGETSTNCQVSPIGRGTGLDVRMYQDSEAHPHSLARCVAYLPRRPRAEDILPFSIALARQRIETGFFISRAGFDPSAIEMAAHRGVVLIEPAMLLTMIQRLTVTAQTRLLGIATEGDWITPICPTCDIQMEMRDRISTSYWRCPNATQCGHRLPVALLPTAQILGTCSHPPMETKKL